MILSRVIEHVKAQNWTAVALDFFGVFAGVLAALQLNGWANARADFAAGAELQARLIDELELEQTDYDHYVNYFRSVRDHIETALLLYGEPAQGGPQDFLISAYNATQYIEPRPHRTVYEEITAADELRLIRDRDFREGLRRYHHNEDREKLSAYALNAAYRGNLRRAMSQSIQRAVRENCGDVRGEAGFVIGLKSECQLGVGKNELEAEYQRLLGDVQLRRDLQLFASTFGAYLADVEAQGAALDRLIKGEYP